MTHTHTQCAVVGAGRRSGMVQKERIGQLKPYLGSQGFSYGNMSPLVKKQRMGQLKPYLGSQSLTLRDRVL